MNNLQTRVSSVALVVGGVSTVLLRLAPIELVPLLLLSLGITAFGAWGFADEMGLRKPLNRAGLVSFAFAVMAKTVALMEGTTAAQSDYYILFAFSLLLALLLWSIALLHRKGNIKVAGLFGVMGSTLPILLLIAGHLSVGVGTIWGVGMLYDTTAFEHETSSTIRNVETVFLIWSLISAGLLWSGKIVKNSNSN